MKFKNPENNFIESRTLPALWALLFGGLYFVVCGAWGHVVVWVIVAIMIGSLMGPMAVPFWIILNVVYAVMAPSVVKQQYLRRGWIEVDHAEGDNSTSTTPKLRKCPFCAEEIKVEAVKCKHCGSEVTAPT